jgi:Heavy-metal-associated domain
MGAGQALVQAASAAQDPVHHLEQLVDLGIAAAGLDLLADAAADVAVEQPQRHLVEGGLDGRGVHAAAVDVAARTVEVTYDAAAVTPATIRATLAEEGYEVAG